MFHTPSRKIMKGAVDLLRSTSIGDLIKRDAGLNGLVYTRDAMMTFDSELAALYPGQGITTDSTGVFLISQLERLDRTLNEPLFNTTWQRDIDLRGDVSLADEVASWTLSNYASPGNVTPSGISWVSANANAIAGPALDIGKIGQPLFGWAQELSWSVYELAKSQVINQPVDMTKRDAMMTKWEMDVDQVVYTGEAAFTQYGMLNSPAVTVAAAPNGASGSPLWANKTPQERLNDVNSILNAAWLASGYAVMPDQLRLPPAQFLGLNATIVSSAGSMSILEFLRTNNAAVAINGRPLNIQPIKWLTGRGVGATDRMYAYTRMPKYLRYPMVPLARTPQEQRSLFQLVTYYAKLGFVEHRYPETEIYMDGI